MTDSVHSNSRRLHPVLLLGALGLLTAAAVAAQGIQEYPLPTAGLPYGITAGPDGALWVANLDRINRITTSGTVTSFGLGSVQLAQGIVVGPDGNLWFADSGNNMVGRLTTAGVLTQFPVSSSPQWITPGPDGALWVTERFADKIGRITTAGVATEFPVSKAAGPNGIIAGPDGALWFTEVNADKIGRMTTAGVVTNEFPVLSANPALSEITVGPDGALWFNESGASKVGHITTSGTVTEFPLPVTTRNYDLAFGPDGALWLGEFDTDRIARMTTSGAVTEYFLETPDAGPLGITPGPDGALWFTEFKGNKIGRVVPPGPVPPARLYTLTPCRIADTRNPRGPFGGPPLVAGADRPFLLSGRCGIPPTARAVVANVTVTQPSAAGHLTIYPAGAALPQASTINYSGGQTRANGAVLSLGSGMLLVRCGQPSGTANLILDVLGYFQ